jgi:hypothetical protein
MASPTKPKIFPLFDKQGAVGKKPPGATVGIWVQGMFHAGCCCKDHDPEQLWAQRSAELAERRKREQSGKSTK